MASDGNPDLAAVLKTLSAFAPPTNTNNASFSSGTNPSLHHTSSSRDDEYDPSDVLSLPPFQHQLAPRQPAISDSSTTAPGASLRAGTNTPDASTIVTWPAALKHVMRTVSQNEALQSKIRRLIRSQHDHEKQWWKGREALIAKQKARVEKKKKLDEVLRSVGAPVDSKEVSTAEEDRAELNNYDAKVYRASADMSKALDSELRALGIPFFAVKHSLVRVIAGEAEKPRPEPSTTHADPDGNGNGTLSREELWALQRRMLELLQDLCRE